jgi:hypothetical protein
LRGFIGELLVELLVGFEITKSLFVLGLKISQEEMNVIDSPSTGELIKLFLDGVDGIF